MAQVDQPTTVGRKLRLVAYVRVSTGRQAAEGLGLEVQRRAIRSWAREAGHRVVLWAGDEGVSGSNGVEGRVGLYEALAAVTGRDADGVVTYNLDRLARRLEVQEGILGKVWAAGGRVFTVEDGEVLEDDPDDPFRTAMRQMRGVFSQLERGMIAKRMRAGRRLKGEWGGYAYGAPPFGFQASGGGLVPVESEQAAIGRAVQLRQQGASLRAIAAVLTAEQIPTKRGGRWHPFTVRQLLERQDTPSGAPKRLRPPR